MEINLRHPNFSLTEDQKAYISEKVEHLKKYCERLDDPSTKIEIDIRPSKRKATNDGVSFQITIYVPRAVIRAEISATTVQEATDLAMEKLRGQIDRYKGKQHRRNKGGEWIPASTLEAISETHEKEYMDIVAITKRKKFSNALPMHEDEALEQLELLGHSFFVFKNVDTGLYNVVYKREDGTYGLIELSCDVNN